MRIVLIGQSAFGDAVLKALLDCGKEVVGVSTPPDRGGRPDPLKATAQERGIPWLATSDLKQDQVFQQFVAWKPDLGVMAFVTDILQPRVLEEPRLGTIQYHPSLLPKHRGASAINWAIAMEETHTGLTIFWPDRGIDTGPVLLQKEVDIDPDDTVGSLYFNKLFPLGVETMVEAVGLVEAGQAPKISQDESHATYEPIFRGEHATIDWTAEARHVYSLVRASDPQPGASTTYKGSDVLLYEASLNPGPTATPPGQVLSLSQEGMTVALLGGALQVRRVRPAGGAKIAASQWATDAGINTGDKLGS